MQNSDKKDKKMRRIIELVELAILFLFFAFIICGFSLYKYATTKDFSSYQIFLQDVDGLIIGSPVKLMGIQVGYVRQVKIVNELVFVDFIITEKNLKLPKGSVITVEFNGLAGSKSLEIYTPEEIPTETETYLIVKNPTRLKDVASYMDVIYDKLTEITLRAMIFADEVKVNSSDIKKANHIKNDDVKDSLKDADKWLDERLQDRLKKKNNNK